MIHRRMKTPAYLFANILLTVLSLFAYDVDMAAFDKSADNGVSVFLTVLLALFAFGICLHCVVPVDTIGRLVY